MVAPNLADLAAATERLHKAMGAEIEARATLIGFIRAAQKRELPDDAVRFIESRAAELIPDGRFTGTVSLNVLLSALGDAWKAGQVHQQRLSQASQP